MLLYHDYNNDVKYLLLVLPSIEYLHSLHFKLLSGKTGIAIRTIRIA